MIIHPLYKVTEKSPSLREKKEHEFPYLELSEQSRIIFTI
jgi:hypothetical protein